MSIDIAQLVYDLFSVAPLFIVLGVTLIGMLVSAFNSNNPTIPYIHIFGYLTGMVVLILQNDVQRISFSGLIQIGEISRYGSLILLAVVAYHSLFAAVHHGKSDGVKGEFFVLTGFAVTGMLMMINSNDLIMTFIGLETMSIPFYVLAGYYRQSVKSNESAMKYFLIGSFAAGFVLYGIALMYGATGSTNYAEIFDKISLHSPDILFWTGFFFLLIGFLFKLSAVPFHFWAPDVYHGAGAISASILASTGKVSIVITLSIFILQTIQRPTVEWTTIIFWISILSMVVGNLMALVQSNVQRMIAFSSVAHAGYMLMAFTSFQDETLLAVFYYVAVYGITTVLAFGILSLLESGKETVSLESIKGIGYSRKLEAFGLSIVMFSLMGLPPFGGFIGKYLVFLETWKSGETTLVIVGILTSMISVAYYLKVIFALYANNESEHPVVKSSFLIRLTICLGVVFLIISGIWPTALYTFLPSL